MNQQDKIRIFDELTSLIKKQTGPVELRGEVFNSKAKDKKRQLHLYGKKEMSILGREEQQTYIGGVIEQKNFVGFYVMALYSHPDRFVVTHPDLIKMKKGKSCFNLTKLDGEMKKELASLLNAATKLYKEEGWI